MNYNKFIDHTLLKANATDEAIIKLCEEALQYDFASVCVNPGYIKLCAEKLKGSDVKVCTVVGFPLGATSTEAKVFETKQAVKVFVKEFDGEYPAKDSLGVLDSLPNEIPNDLSIVINAIDEYYN